MCGGDRIDSLALAKFCSEAEVNPICATRRRAPRNLSESSPSDVSGTLTGYSNPQDVRAHRRESRHSPVFTVLTPHTNSRRPPHPNFNIHRPRSIGTLMLTAFSLASLTPTTGVCTPVYVRPTLRLRAASPRGHDSDIGAVNSARDSRAPVRQWDITAAGEGFVMGWEVRLTRYTQR